MSEFFTQCAELSSRKEPFVVVTLISGRGHIPQEPGAKAIVTRAGLQWGTVGGGKVEKRAIEDAMAMLSRLPEIEPPRLVTWNLQRDIGMTCGGECTYLFETHFAASWKIAVFGAGHVSQALVRALIPLECEITCIDTRPEWIEKLPSSPNLAARCVPEMAALVPGLGGNTFFISMTQGHATDVPVLEAILRHFPDAPYIGVIGSNAKAIKIRAELKERGVSETLLERLRCPVGLPLGNSTPAEIAISIAAELIQVRDRMRSLESARPLS